MWSKSDPEAKGPKLGSEVVAMSEIMPPEGFTRPVSQPVVGSVTHSKRVHVGHKFYKITQNVDNTEMVKAYPFPQYVWNIAKNSTRAERLSCAASVVALLLCTALIVYFTVIVKKSDINSIDRAPHPWNITREMWRARPTVGNSTQDLFSPIKLVVIHHSVSAECHRFTICAAEMRNLQNYFLDSPHLGWDLPYSFAIGNDGRVYRVRDWNREGAHTPPFNRCAVGIGFIGDYREDLNVHSKVTDLQLERLQLLLKEGVDRGFLRPDYSILGGRDIANTLSPGENLYRAIQALDHYDKTDYRGLTCEKLQEMLD